MMGLVKASEISKKYNVTFDSINEILVMYPNFQAAKNLKAKISLMV